MSASVAMRRVIGTEITGRVTDALHRIVPASLAAWPEAWDHVEAPSRDYLDALRAWEEQATPETEAELRRRSAMVIAAWDEAKKMWETAGSPESSGWIQAGAQRQELA